MKPKETDSAAKNNYMRRCTEKTLQIYTHLYYSLGQEPKEMR